MARRGAYPPHFRSRVEQARLDSLALFRALDRVGLDPTQIPQKLLQKLFELDADCAEALWCLEKPKGRFDVGAMVRDTLLTLAALPTARDALRSKLPPAVRTRQLDLETAIRNALDPREAYNDIPGRDPHVR